MDSDVDLNQTDGGAHGRIQVSMRNLQVLLDECSDTHHLSPQLCKRLTHLFHSLAEPSNVSDIIKKVKSVFNRLILELVQAQYNTKQREQDFVRLIESKGCSIRDLELVDHVIELLVRLYRASIHYSDSSLERRNLIKYIMKELGPNQKGRQRDVERVVQTIYWASCFHVTQQDGNPSRLRLKDNLYDATELRNHLNVRLINLAKENSIRLPTESWAYLLHGRSTPENMSKIQSALDKHISPVDTHELKVAIKQSGDKLGLSPHINLLHEVQDMIHKFESLSSPESNMELTSGTNSNRNDESHDDFHDVLVLVEKLVKLKHLFTVRQHRIRLAYAQF